MSKVDNGVITLDQINKCMSNGNYKLGKLCGGWHSVANVKQRNIQLPEVLPDNTTAFLYCNGNVVFYIAGGVGNCNVDSVGKLSPIQQATLDHIKTLVGSKCNVVEYNGGWVNVGGGKAGNVEDTIANKVLSMC